MEGDSDVITPFQSAEADPVEVSGSSRDHGQREDSKELDAEQSQHVEDTKAPEEEKVETLPQKDENAEPLNESTMEDTMQGVKDDDTMDDDVMERKTGEEEKSAKEEEKGETKPGTDSIMDSAKSFFHSLLPENQTVLTQDTLKNALSGAAMSANKVKQIKVMEKILSQSEALTEDEFIGKAVNLAEGILPEELGNLADLGNLDTDIDLEEYEKATPAQKIMKYPGYTVKSAVNYVVDLVSNKGLSWLHSMIPTQQIQTLLLIFLYSICTRDTVLFVVPLFLQYISFFSLIICTLQMFQGKKKSLNLKVWAEMLKEQLGSEQSQSTESQFAAPSVKPYLSFATALLMFVVTFPFVSPDWAPYSEFTIVAVFFTFTCFVGLDDSDDHLTMHSMIIQVISAVYSHIEGTSYSREGPLSYIFHAFTCCSTSVSFADGFHLHLGPSTIIHLLVPVLLIRLAFQKSGRGVHQVLLPHLVCVMWLQLAVTCFADATSWGLMRGLFGWWAMVFLAPLMVLFTLLGLVVWFIKAVFITGSALKILISLIMLGAVLGLPVYLSKGLQLPFTVSKNIMTTVLMVAGILSLFPALFMTLRQPRPATSVLMWEDYHRLCGPGVIEQGSMVNAQMLCRHLQGHWITWQGNVTGVKVTSIDNKAETMFSVLPSLIGNWFSCVYGDPFPDCSNEAQNVSQSDKLLCEMKAITGRDCHMTHFDTLTFQVSVKMRIQSGKSNVINLIAPHTFKDTVFPLKSGNIIEFGGTLTSNLGQPNLMATLYSLTCLNCNATSAVQAAGYHTQTFTEQIMDAVGFTFNFFFSPVLSATADEIATHIS
ncbi:wolframin-like [Ptychodera flava]|uniref:wolframin-like n=1 Tax=Ptychodera flava TaxID=63121 RepID=UPI00396A91F2